MATYKTNDPLVEWLADMTARGKTPKHAEQFHERAAKVAALVRSVRLSDIELGRKCDALARAAVALGTALTSARLSDERIQAALAKLRDAGKSLQTVNLYRAAFRAFVRWAGDTGRLRDNPMRGVRGFNAEEDPRHERRCLTDDELERLTFGLRTLRAIETIPRCPGERRRARPGRLLS